MQGKTRYAQVAETLKARIESGIYPSGSPLPRQHDLAKELGVAFNTLKSALDILEKERYVVRIQGRGTYASLPVTTTKTALVVDDEPSIRSFLGTLLDENGWEYVAVESGELALEAVKERRFGLTFLDLAMPGMNGVETFREMRKIDPEATVVIITAYIESSLVNEAIEIGPFSVLRKPFAIEDVELLLRTIAAGDKMQAEGGVQ